MKKNNVTFLHSEMHDYINEKFGKTDYLFIDSIYNNIDNTSTFLLELNKKNKKNKIFIGFAETHTVRKQRLLHKYPYPINYIYYMGDFLLTRVSPKLKSTKTLYQKLSKGKGRVLSKTEILGKLYYYGFEVIDEATIDNKFFFVTRKKEDFVDRGYVPDEGPIIKLPRIGKNGKQIKVYKFRTMHPYAEFIQEYVYQKNDLQEGGKLKDDFRISTIGKFMRKYWIDELPMFINVIKGDMKLIGVRPLSQHFMKLYSDEMQSLRIQTKPGLLPPGCADNPKTLEEIQISEKSYLEKYFKNPIQTDFKFFLKIIKAILFEGRRSS